MPADVILLTGNRSKLSAEEIEARREAEVRAKPIRPDPPPHLSPYARECWDRLSAELGALGLLTGLDVTSFELACEAYGLAREALEAMRPRRSDGQADGRTNRREVITADETHGGSLRKHPGFAVYNMAANSYRAWCVEFGLTPAARVALRGRGPVGGEGDHRHDGDGDEAFFG